MVRSTPLTAIVSPKRFSICSSRTSAMSAPLEQSAADRAAAALIEQRQAVGHEAQADIGTRLHVAGGFCARLDLAEIGVDRDDLGGAQIFAAIDRAPQRRSVVEADMLRPHTQRQIAWRH